MIVTPERDVITVDGLAASGKSAIAKGLAKALGYCHLNSGLLYRAVAYLCLHEGVQFTDEAGVLAVMAQHSIRLESDDTCSSVVAIDGSVYTADLLSNDVSRGASLVARHQAVRDLLITSQREAFKHCGVVAEGRDMGTKIFPDARIKFFVVAGLNVRAARRYQQLRGGPHEASLEEVTKDIAERDTRDATSAVGTMKQADTAVVVDNSDESLGDIVARLAAVVTAAPPSQR